MKKIYFLLVMLATTVFCEDSITTKQLINQAEMELKSKNIDKVKELLNQACEIGSSDGCNYMGNILIQQGNGAEAFRYLSRACDAGSSQGCFNVGFLNEGGIFIKRDINSAIRAYNKACDGKYAEGCNKMGDLFYKGQYGIPSDNTKANAFYAKARHFGFKGGWVDRAKEEEELYKKRDEVKAKELREKIENETPIRLGFQGKYDPKYIEYQEELRKKFNMKKIN